MAEDFKKKLEGAGALRSVVSEINVEGAFLNFTLSPEFLRAQFLSSLIRANGRIADSRAKKGRVVLVEYSSPNIGKSLSIAHIRSTVIGDALARMYRFLGHRVIADNHLGDWGLQAGALIAAYKLWEERPVSQLTIEDWTELYVRFSREKKEHLELESKAKMETVLLQKGDRDSVKIWKAISAVSRREFDRMYRLLGVQFDKTLGESFYRKLFRKTVQTALQSGVAKESEGAIVIPMNGDPATTLTAGDPPFIIQKNDGGYLYGTFDLATMQYRLKRFKPSLMLYVVANEQSLYFTQLFHAAEKLGWVEPGRAAHVKFGMVRGEDSKRLSTRAGKTIALSGVIEEAVVRARKIVVEKNSELSESEKDEVARMVGVGALKYNDLSQNRNTDITFDWDTMLDFQGNSAPYLQYTYARLRSILRKTPTPAPKILGKFGMLGSLKERAELALMKKSLQLSEAVEDAAKEYVPNLLANYLWELANEANAFYEKYPVLRAERGVREARLALIDGASRVLQRGLSLLGIEAPERV